MIKKLILFVTVLMWSILAATAQPTATNFGVNDAFGNPNTFVQVPVNITNVQNGPAASIIFDIIFDPNVINLTKARVTRGDLTSGWDAPTFNPTNGRISIVYNSGTEIPNGSSGSVVILNFSVVGAPGAKSIMNISKIQLSDLDGNVGTALPKNGTFKVDAGSPIVANSSANPATIAADGIQESILNVTVVDDIGVNIAVINLTPIGGQSKVVMNQIQDNIGNITYSIATNASGVAAGTYFLQVNATDLVGNYNNTVDITLNVTSVAGSIVGNIMYSNNGTGILSVPVNLTNTSGVVASITTNDSGHYSFSTIAPGSYNVNASKLRFFRNSTIVLLNNSETKEVNLILWRKGDLNNNGEPADAGDLVLMKRAANGEIEADFRFDLNNNGEPADAGDLVLMKRAANGEIELL